MATPAGMEVNRIIHGDALDVLRDLPDASVDCVVTSPPYFGLRDYGTATWDGGDPDCDHKVGRFERGGLSSKQASNSGSGGDEARAVCPKCGAIRIDQQIGLEATPAEYVARMVAVFAEVRRVLADDGTAWVNIGDSYYNYRPGNYDDSNPHAFGGKRDKYRGQPSDPNQSKRGKVLPGLQEKALIGIPWRLAFGLQDDGWILRSDIIWAKSNPMPESVRDRPTKSHEYVFLLSKQPRYWYDAEAISERATHAGKVVSLGEKSLSRGQANGMNVTASGNGAAQSVTVAETRNARTVWTINTEPTPFAHFATMPQKLVRRCILAGCKPGGVVLDPFFGSGTTGLVARSVGRRYVGIELNGEYVALAEQRLSEMYTLPMFDRAASGED